MCAFNTKLFIPSWYLCKLLPILVHLAIRSIWFDLPISIEWQLSAQYNNLHATLHTMKRLKALIFISMRWMLIRVDHPFSTEIHRGNEGISQKSLALTVSEVTLFKTHQSYHPNSTRLWNMQSSLFSLKLWWHYKRTFSTTKAHWLERVHLIILNPSKETGGTETWMLTLHWSAAEIWLKTFCSAKCRVK